MAKLVVAVIEDPNLSNDVMLAWNRLGVQSATLIESIGMERLRRASLLRDDLPLMPSLEALEESRLLRNSTVFAVVSDAVDVEGLIAATERIVGDLADEN